MSRLLLAGLMLVFFTTALQADEAKNDPERMTFGPTDWPWWRGPDRNGIADAKQKLPLKWSETENVLWKAPIPGRGHGSMSVVGDQVVLATAEHDTEVQSVLCFDRKTGTKLWTAVVHKGKFETKGNAKASMASATLACDGKRFFVNFLNGGAVYTTALDRDGNQLWQTKITDYVLHQGFGSSPAVYQSLVIVSADNKGTGKIVALDRISGKVVWSHDRPKLPNYASPILLTIAGKEQLLLTGCDLVTSLDPLTGKVNWETKGSTTESVTSAVTDGTRIFTSGGYPKNHVSAVVADGTSKIAWENNSRVYVPSMIAKDGCLYAVLDEGVAMCWKSDTGKLLWKERLDGGFTASPVLVGDHLFATNEAGKTFVLKVSSESCTQVSVNKLGDQVYSTPTICGGRIYMRSAVQVDGRRQEMLYCLGLDGK